MKEPVPISFIHTEELPNSPQSPVPPTFGFLLGGTTLGIFFGCILLCAGAGPASVILILLATFGAFTGGILESFWPKPASGRERRSRKSPPSGYTDISVSPFRDERDLARPRTGRVAPTSQHECDRCGELFDPFITCPMCGHRETA